MKVNKTQAMLFIFNVLIKQGFISREDIISALLLSPLAFRRYMQELRAFFTNFNLPYELEYSRSEDRYFLKNI